MVAPRTVRVTYVPNVRVCHIFRKAKEQTTKHHYYFALSGGSRAKREGTSDASESEAMLTKY
jgi:hypothetical protein